MAFLFFFFFFGTFLYARSHEKLGVVVVVGNEAEVKELAGSTAVAGVCPHLKLFSLVTFT